MAQWALASIALVVILGVVAYFAAGKYAEWKPKKALQGVSMIRLRTGGTCHRQLDEERVLYEEKDAAEIQRFIDQIQIDSLSSPCMCCGAPSLEFYRGEAMVVMLGVHHGKNLRWREGWSNDAAMSGATQVFLKQWLADHGVDSEE